MPRRKQILIATLGGQPQVVTFTLDLLLQEGYPISEVIVLHPDTTSQPRLQTALQRLSVEFSDGYYQAGQRHILFRSHVLEDDGQPISDIISSEEHADSILNSVHRLIGDLKREPCLIHLSVSGGRRMISLLALSVASLNFDRHDCIWHIYTARYLQEQARDGKVMHLPASEDLRLTQVPFPALGAYTSPLSSFRSVREEQRLQMEAQEHMRCTETVNRATRSQLRVLQAFAKGLRPQRVAEELGISPVTVHTHKTALLNLCRQSWNIPSEEPLDYLFLRDQFAGYLSSATKEPSRNNSIN